ncbi:hypothetical protein ZWY2020_017201 [Hordeum vulgare]|nr:hypothetical protein ZWY2020_017201 [Hordeum vulgare]
MDDSLGWKKAVEELAGNNQQLRAQYREIARWYPSVQMMRNHACGLVKVTTFAEKQHAFPAGFNIPPPTILLTEHVTDAVLALPAPINTAYWENRNPWVLGPDDDSDDDTSNDSDDEVEELVVLSDEVEEEPIVQLLAPVIDAVEGDKNLPIDVEKLSEVADLLEVVVVKQEVEEYIGAPGKKKSAGVRHSERLKMPKKEE